MGAKTRGDPELRRKVVPTEPGGRPEIGKRDRFVEMGIDILDNPPCAPSGKRRFRAPSRTGRCGDRPIGTQAEQATCDGETHCACIDLVEPALFFIDNLECTPELSNDGNRPNLGWSPIRRRRCRSEAPHIRTHPHIEALAMTQLERTVCRPCGPERAIFVSKAYRLHSDRGRKPSAAKTRLLELQGRVLRSNGSSPWNGEASARKVGSTCWWASIRAREFIVISFGAVCPLGSTRESRVGDSDRMTQVLECTCRLGLVHSEREIRLP